MTTKTEKITWVVVENGLTGTENQCLGVAEALGARTLIKRITLRWPWNLLTPWLGFEQSWTFSPALTAPWPDLVIGGGRKAVAALRYIKKKNPNAYTVMLQDPKTATRQFDLVAAPLHDDLQGENVIQTTAAPNRITAQKLEEAKAAFPAFAQIKSPRVAVLIGGNSHTHKLTPTIMHNLIGNLKKLNAGLMITASRRTGAENLAMLQNAGLGAYIWDGQGPNPYHAMLAWADYIIVTNVSVSMLSDAGGTGKPVYIVELEGSSSKFNRLYKTLRDRNIIRRFEGNLENWAYEPLNDAHYMAQEIKRRTDF